MSIRQAKPPTDRFTQISNLWVRDPQLSWKARGLLTWLTSHSTGFRVSEKTIVCAAPDGRDSARTAIAELETYGYLVRERERGRDGRLGDVTYIICDPWSPQLTTDQPTPENPPLAPTSTNTTKPQLTTYGGKTNAGKPTRIRRPAKQEDQTPEKTTENPPLLAAGEPTHRKGPGTAPTPAANPEELSRMAAELLGKLPDHYRRAPAWLRSRLLKRISEALLRHAPLAIADYCAKFVDDPTFGDYEHLRRFDDVLRKLTADIADGTACPGCGHDPRHPFCTAQMEDTAPRPDPEDPPHPFHETKAADTQAPPWSLLLHPSSEPLTISPEGCRPPAKITACPLTSARERRSNQRGAC